MNNHYFIQVFKLNFKVWCCQNILVLKVLKEVLKFASISILKDRKINEIHSFLFEYLFYITKLKFVYNHPFIKNLLYKYQDSNIRKYDLNDVNCHFITYNSIISYSFDSIIYYHYNLYFFSFIKSKNYVFI